VPDEETTRKLRAKRLREQIERLTTPGNEPKEDVPEEAPGDANPREFIHRKMREWGDKGESSR
jgi:hypothetical protein